MAKIKSLEELKKIKEQAQQSVSLRVKGDNIENLVQVRVAMATCGIAAGARETMNEFIKVLNEEHMDNVVGNHRPAAWDIAMPSPPLS